MYLVLAESAGSVLAPSSIFGLGPTAGLARLGLLKLGAGVNPSTVPGVNPSTGRKELNGAGEVEVLTEMDLAKIEIENG